MLREEIGPLVLAAVGEYHSLYRENMQRLAGNMDARPLLVFAAAAIGNLTADSLWYSLGYLGKTEWILHFGRRLGLRESLINHLKQKMIDHATKMLFLAKLTVSFVIPSLIAAGLLRVPWRRWFPVVAFANMVIAAVFTSIGYFTVFSLLNCANSSFIYLFKRKECDLMIETGSEKIMIANFQKLRSGFVKDLIFCLFNSPP